MKKLSSILLAVIMLLSLSMTAFAADLSTDVNFGDRATSARTFSHTLTAKQPHRHGGQPHL